MFLHKLAFLQTLKALHDRHGIVFHGLILSYNMNCINCGAVNASRLNDENIARIIQQWIAPQLVSHDNYLCRHCFTEAENFKRSNSAPSLKEHHACIICNRSLMKQRSHNIMQLRIDNEHHRNIRNIVTERCLPQVIKPSHHICHPCWQRADRAARTNSVASSSRNNTVPSPVLYCIICRQNVSRLRRHFITNQALLDYIQNQQDTNIITERDCICNGCHTTFLNKIANKNNNLHEPQRHDICTGCGHVIAPKLQSHIIEPQNIKEIVELWIAPRQVEQMNRLCHTCWQKARRQAARRRLPEPAREKHITLPNYLRASNTHNRCVFNNCHGQNQKVVSTSLRRQLFIDFKYYIPQNCRICEHHLLKNNWEELTNQEPQNRTFTAAYIQDFCVLLTDKQNIDFENIQEMDENMVWYWTGRTKQQFRQIENELPNFHRKSLALAAYLIKLRTGDSDERIATLLNLPKSTLNRLMQNARQEMMAHNESDTESV